MRLILVLALSVAHAGWWSDFCERHLIADDPYQYEDVATSWIEHQVSRLEVREAWGKLERREKKQLDILRGELMRRQVR